MSDEEDREVRAVWFDFDGDGVPDLELTDEKVLARLFPPEAVELLREFIKEQGT